MKIAIDINDVLRSYTAQFAKYYKNNVDRSFDVDSLDVWTNNLREIFPFASKKDYLEFLYNDYAFEIYGAAPTVGKNLEPKLTNWCKEIENLDEIPELCIVSTGEYEKTIGSTHFFLGKIAIRIRETHLLLSEDKVWDLCDVLITANPDLLALKPENKVSVKIETTYNQEKESDLKYETLIDFLDDLEAIEKINNKLNK